MYDEIYNMLTRVDSEVGFDKEIAVCPKWLLQIGKAKRYQLGTTSRAATNGTHSCCCPLSRVRGLVRHSS